MGASRYSQQDDAASNINLTNENLQTDDRMMMMNDGSQSSYRLGASQPELTFANNTGLFHQ